ncbi:hypothetical protein QBC45DRAFT_4314 [Copromyces sp. CBS 386.78]|nr:hypothetical protein QBC45DRAFT_4314 [Copromyces sp. CBS 386.78]
MARYQAGQSYLLCALSVAATVGSCPGTNSHPVLALPWFMGLRVASLECLNDGARHTRYGDLGEPCPTSATCCCPMAGRHLHKVVISPTTKRVALRPAGLSLPSCHHFQVEASTGPHGNRLSEPCRCRFPERDPGPAVRLCAVFCTPMPMHKTVEPLSRRRKDAAHQTTASYRPLCHDEPHQYMALVHHPRSLTAGRLPSKEFENDHGSS